MHLDSHTKLPKKEFVLEKIGIFKQYTNELSIILLSIKNFNNIAKWHGRAETIATESKFSTMVKELVQKFIPDTFIGYFGENKIIIISESNELEALYDKLKDMTLPTIISSSKDEEADFHLSVNAKILQLDTDKKLNDLEVDLTNAYDLM